MTSVTFFFDEEESPVIAVTHLSAYSAMDELIRELRDMRKHRDLDSGQYEIVTEIWALIHESFPESWTA